MIISLGVSAPFAQLFTEVHPKDIETARNEHIDARDLRDDNRVDGMQLLEKSLYCPEELTQDEIIRGRLLILEHKLNEKKSLELYATLSAVKDSHVISGFPNFNSFLNGIGNPIFILIIGFVSFLLYRSIDTIDKSKMKNFFLLVTLICSAVAGTYLVWVFNPGREMHQYFYLILFIITAIFCAFLLNKITKYLTYNNMIYKVIGEYVNREQKSSNETL